LKQALTVDPAADVLEAAVRARVELGRALAFRAVDATRMASEATAEAGLTELAASSFAKRVRHVHHLATMGIAHLLMTGQGGSEKERNFIGKLGVRAAVLGIPVAAATRSYLYWRDSNLEVLDEEARRLGTPPDITTEARAVVRSQADIGIVRLARAYDHQMHVIAHREDSGALALRDSEAQLHGAIAAESKKNAELLSAMAEISRKNRQLEGVNRQQSVFIANVSHELRTPLAGILGHAEMLLEGLGGAAAGDQREDLEAIQAGGLMLLALLNDILDESQIEAGTLRLDIGRVDLRAMIDAAVAAARPAAESKQLYIRADIRNAAVALGDQSRLTQILTNLIGNAIKFTDGGGVTVNCLPWAGFWRVSVTDTGIGLSETSQLVIFDRFVQVDASITRRFGGLGLGLSIVRGLVAMQGGEVGVDSRPGRGSTFWFTVPSFHQGGGAARVPRQRVKPA
jgi:signal transduction histidine kinase